VVSACGLKGLAHQFGVDYLQIMVVTICLQTAGQIGMACIRGAGDTLRPMVITAAIALVNVVTVPTLAKGLFGFPVMGIRGNALGTAIAFAISGVLAMLLLQSGWSRLRLRRRHFKIVPHILMRVLRIGLPSWAEGMLLWAGQFLIVIVIINRNDHALAAFWGTAQSSVDGVTMAAHQATLRIESFAFLPGFGFGIAASTMVGQYLGSKRPEEARVAARKTAALALGTMTLAALPMVFLPDWIMRMVVNSRHVAEVGYWPMVLAGLAQPGFAIAIIAGSALKGAGDTISVMVSTITGMFVVRFPIVLGMVWVFGRMGHWEWGLIAVWIGIFVDLNYRAAFNTIVFLRGKWRFKKV
jgi:Na+-driven multidrug efflux pump